MAELDHITLAAIVDEISLNLNTAWDYCAVLGIVCGSVVVLRCLYHSLRCVRTYLVSRLLYSRNLAKTYGGKWAVVSGASEGIGRSYALQLAQRKMNVFLISRSAEKLKKVSDEIHSKHNVETKCFPLDLTELSQPQVYDKLRNELSTIDVGVLVNNVGVMYDTLQWFLTVPRDRLTQIVQLNISATILLTHIVLPQMVDRSNGAIINVSSGSTVKPTPLMTAYSASKSFVDSFTDALQAEYPSITMQTVRPFYVSTEMTNRGSPNVLLVDADAYVSSALRTLGFSRCTYGYWVHGLFGLVGEMMTGWFFKVQALYVHPVLWTWLTGSRVEKKKTL